MTTAETRAVRLADIEFDAGTQTRAQIDIAVVEDYAEAMANGSHFPPVTLFQDGATRRYFIGDGWHRMLAAKSNDVVSYPATVGIGGRSAAIRHALGANASHGLRRTNADKRRAVAVALAEFPNVSDREIAKWCGVDHKTVGQVRYGSGAEIPHLNGSQVGKFPTSTHRIGGDGKTYQATQLTRGDDSYVENEAQEEPQAVRGDFPMPPPEPPPPPWTVEAMVSRVKRMVIAELNGAPDHERRAAELALAAMVNDLCGTVSTAATKPKSDATQVDEIYRAYPRKTAPAAAKKAIKKALSDVAFPELLEATKAYAAAVATWDAKDKKYVPHPATWFNRGSYGDDRSEWQRGNVESVRLPSTQLAL